MGRNVFQHCYPPVPPPEGSSPQNKELLNSSDDEEMHTTGEKGSPELGNDETETMSTMFASTLSDDSLEFVACSFRGDTKRGSPESHKCHEVLAKRHRGPTKSLVLALLDKKKTS